MMLFGRKRQDITKNPFYKEKDALVIYLKCDRCGEYMTFRILKERDFVVSYDGRSALMIDKLYVCPKCYNQISLKAGFKATFKPMYFELNGGKFVAKEEYEQQKGG